MKKIFILLLFISLTSSNVFGNAIENFKNLEYEMIFESDTINVDGVNEEAQQAKKRINLFNSLKESLEEKRQNAEIKKKEVEQRIYSLEENVTQLEQEIEDAILEIEGLNREITKTNNRIKQTKNTIEIMTRKVKKSEDSLKKYITHIYAEGNLIYEDGEIDNLKAILLSGEDIGDLISDNHYKTLIQITGKKLLDQHRSNLRELYVKRLELEKDNDELKVLRKNQVIARKTAEDKRKIKKNLIEASRGEQATYASYIREKIARENELKQRVEVEQFKYENLKDDILGDFDCEFVDIETEPNKASKLSKECFDVNRVAFAETKLKESAENEAEANPFAWPVSPARGITAYFSDDEYIQYLGTDHEALDVRAPQGTDIKAAADGYVVYILPPTSAEYAYIALKHANGLVSVYGHVSQIDVERYDYVKKGQVFAKSGGAPGTLGAGYLSTGPHLHFVTYYENKLADPLQFLDVSQLDVNTLPEKYIYKYYGDYQARTGQEYAGSKKATGVFSLEGSTEIERQKSLLAKYAAPDFKNWNTWVEESVDGGVDPSFVMCLGLAETGLGRNLKTRYNVGNVGNTDSGATLTFSNAREGIYVVVKGLNNKYLGQYDTVNMLSRYGNKDTSKPIYASSPDHWHNNITKCLSAIKGKYIPDNYKFRIDKL